MVHAVNWLVGSCMLELVRGRYIAARAPLKELKPELETFELVIVEGSCNGAARQRQQQLRYIEIHMGLDEVGW